MKSGSHHSPEARGLISANTKIGMNRPDVKAGCAARMKGNRFVRKPIWHKPKYPKLPRELDRRWKVTEGDITLMRKMRHEGMSYYSIARKIGISYSTAYYWCVASYRKWKRKMNANRRMTPHEAVLNSANCRRYAQSVLPERKDYDTILNRRNNQLRIRRLLKTKRCEKK